MTVCIAARFRWNYATAGDPADWGPAVVTASDRMISWNDVEYEPLQRKVAEISPTGIILIAGDYGTHTQSLKEAHAHLVKTPNADAENIARVYAAAMQRQKQREAEALYLAPLGMNTDTFLAQMNEYSDAFVSRITDQMQAYRGEAAEALVAAGKDGAVSIYSTDSAGSVQCCDDVGFAAIGLGSWHAKSYLMQSGYVNTLNFSAATAAVYAAKKASEIAPGVGSNTDLYVVWRDARGHVPQIWPDLMPELDRLYKDYEGKHTAIQVEKIHELQKFLDGYRADAKTDGQDKSANDGASKNASEAAREPENQTKKGEG